MSRALGITALVAAIVLSAGPVASSEDTRTVRLSAYFPRYKLQAPPTGADTLERAHAIFSKRLHHVYLGNVLGAVGSDTACHGCSARLIARRGYSTQIVGLDGAKCAQCGADNNVIV